MINKKVNQEIDSKYTFWKLLSEYYVEIPIIQRDYAQGRRSDEATAIRGDFLNSIYSALLTKTPLDFDFVYGTVEGNILYPLDGQQRLTTFFLLHWYVAAKEKKLDEVKAVLGKFSYTTRTSSREFCEMLVNLKYEPSVKEKVSSFIRNENGYFGIWDSDPTISHMLTMLDDIHDKFFDADCLFALLFEDELLTFNYLSMEHYALTDDLYIKMNARGKALSIFENFKAKFIQHMKELSLSYDYFEASIDGAWTDLLWDYRAADNTIDKQFMNLFCYITEMLFLEYEQQRDGESPFTPTAIRKLIDFYDSDEKVNKFYLYMDLWESKSEAVAFLSEIFTDENDDEKVRLFEGKVDIFNSIIEGEIVGLHNKLLLYSLMKRIVEYGIDKDINVTRDYIRVIRNIITNYRQFVKKKCTFSSDFRYGRHAIPLVQEFISVFCLAENPYSFIINKDFETINGEVFTQERRKAEIIVNRPELKKKLHCLEDMEIFKGTLFNIIPYVLENEDESLVSNLRTLFLEENGSDIIRAMLSIKDYGISVGSSAFGNKFFYGCKTNWYSLLTYSGGDKFTGFICEFINQFEHTESDSIEESLNELILHNLDKISKNDWRYTIVKYKDTLSNVKGYIDNPYMILAMEQCEDGSSIPHRQNGFILNGYHVVPDYFEIRNQLGKMAGAYIYGFGSEHNGRVNLSFVENLAISYNQFGNSISCRKEDEEWVSEVIKKYKSIDMTNMDKIEKAVILAKLLKEKSDEVFL